MAIRHLKRFGLFQKLPAKLLKRIEGIAKTEAFPAGTLIFNKAESSEHMFVVISGRVKIFSRSSARKRKTFAYLERGDFFGEMGIIDEKSRSASAEAVEDSALLIIRKQDFRKLLLADAKLCFFILQAVSERLRRTNEEIESLLFRNILGRVAKALYDLSGREKSRGSRVVLRQRFTHQDLADLVGTTREPLSRALAILKHADLVETSSGRIVVRDIEKLEALTQRTLRTD